MTGYYADLHIHSHYSDGTMAPAEILAAAEAGGLSLIALTDHNRLEGSRELRALCRGTGIRMVPAVELDSLDGGSNIHILGYGADLDDPAFCAFVRRSQACLERVSRTLIERMGCDWPGISLEEYGRFRYNRKKGGWKALHYLLGKGAAGNLKEAVGLYARYNCPMAVGGFPSVAAVCSAIHAAGGRAVLAHPGESLVYADIRAFERELERFAGLGLDGVECHYPTHSPEVTRACVRLCDEGNLLITSGSDCHGGFGRTSVGGMKVTVGMLRLGDLVK